MSKRHQVDPELVAMLEEAEVDYEFVNGGKHLKLRVRGRLVLTLPFARKQDNMNRQVLNARAALKRHLEGLR